MFDVSGVAAGVYLTQVEVMVDGRPLSSLLTEENGRYVGPLVTIKAK